MEIGLGTLGEMRFSKFVKDNGYAIDAMLLETFENNLRNKKYFNSGNKLN